MSVEPLSVPAPVASWPLYRAMVGIGLLCGTLIVVVFQTTRPVIARNQAAALEAAIFEVLPGASQRQSFVLDEAESFSPLAEGAAASADRLVHAGYDDGGRLLGIAIEAAGMGYQDTIRVLYGFSPEADAIVGLRVLESKETPGLGDRIESDPDFRRNFERLDVSLDENGAIRNAIVAVPQGSKVDAWQVDGITGATISSKAIANMLANSTATWIPRARQRLEDFTRNGASDG